MRHIKYAFTSEMTCIHVSIILLADATHSKATGPYNLMIKKTLKCMNKLLKVQRYEKDKTNKKTVQQRLRFKDKQHNRT